MWAEVFVAYFEKLFDTFQEGQRKTTKNFRIVGVLVEIRTGYVPNTTLMHYRFIGAIQAGNPSPSGVRPCSSSS
jgi:hypothetical protein